VILTLCVSVKVSALAYLFFFSPGLHMCPTPRFYLHIGTHHGHDLSNMACR
jgi:hypothetical protein